MTYACIFHPKLLIYHLSLPFAFPWNGERKKWEKQLCAGEGLRCVECSIIYTLKGDSIWRQSWVVWLALLIYFVLILFSVFRTPATKQILTHKSESCAVGGGGRDFVGKHIYISAFRPRFLAFCTITFGCYMVRLTVSKVVSHIQLFIVKADCQNH